MQPTESDRQERILRMVTVLHALRESWDGELIVACGLNPHGAALALASNIAGAVCLSVEGDPATLKEALRSGSCDFIVNTLDEALRAMKNEVRKHLSLSVGLQGDPALVLQELLERGVAPGLFTDFTGSVGGHKAIAVFRSGGALVVGFDENFVGEGVLDVADVLHAYLGQRGWFLHSFPFSSTAALRAFDAEALTLLPEDDLLRRRWLGAASRILQRERPIRRVLWVTEYEKQVLEASSSKLV